MGWHRCCATPTTVGEAGTGAARQRNVSAQAVNHDGPVQLCDRVNVTPNPALKQLREQRGEERGAWRADYRDAWYAWVYAVVCGINFQE